MAVQRIWFPQAPQGSVNLKQRSLLSIGIEVEAGLAALKLYYTGALQLGKQLLRRGIGF